MTTDNSNDIDVELIPAFQKLNAALGDRYPEDFDEKAHDWVQSLVIEHMFCALINLDSLPFSHGDTAADRAEAEGLADSFLDTFAEALGGQWRGGGAEVRDALVEFVLVCFKDRFERKNRQTTAKRMVEELNDMARNWRIEKWNREAVVSKSSEMASGMVGVVENADGEMERQEKRIDESGTSDEGTGNGEYGEDRKKDGQEITIRVTTPEEGEVGTTAGKKDAVNLQERQNRDS